MSGNAPTFPFPSLVALKCDPYHHTDHITYENTIDDIYIYANE